MGPKQSLSSDEGFTQFATGCHRALFALALSLTGDRGAAEDLVQTALARTYQHWSRLSRPEQNPLAYARRIVVNANTDRWRRHRGREHLTDVIPEPTSPDASEQVAERAWLLQALQQLTVKERRVVALRFLLDLSEQQVADELDMNPAAVRSATYRAVQKLRAQRVPSQQEQS
jgi:RNA polymerase sigma-70 factor (sigma-E family)